MRSADRADLVEALRVADRADDPDALAEDEHERYRLYLDALERVPREDERRLLFIVSRDPDRTMRESAIAAHVDAVAAAITRADAFRAWTRSIEDILRQSAFVQRRVEDWLLAKDLLEDDRRSLDGMLEASDWLQRKLSQESSSGRVLAALASHGRTGRIRNTAARRLRETGDYRGQQR